MAPGITSMRCCWPARTRRASSTGRYRWTPRSRALISMRRTSPASQGASSNYKNPLIEPPDHGIGRSRGGLSTKLHHLVDGCGLPLVIAVTPGQSGDSPMLIPLLEQLRVARPTGRPRTRPDRVRGDKAYSSRAIRQHLRGRGVQAVIPQPSDQIGHRLRRGSRGGRPVTYDHDDYRHRNVIERRFASLKQWRGIATRYDKRRPRSPQRWGRVPGRAARRRCRHRCRRSRRDGSCERLLRQVSRGVAGFVVVRMAVASERLLNDSPTHRGRGAWGSGEGRSTFRPVR